AADGWIIQHFPTGVFVLPMLAAGTSALLLALARNVEPREGQALAAPAAAAAAHHPAPEPQLLGMRKLALWLSRIALPATYVLIYSLLAMMPSLPLVRRLPPVAQTLVSSVWLAMRFVMFAWLGATTWWHTRPRLLLGAAWLM